MDWEAVGAVIGGCLGTIGGIIGWFSHHKSRHTRNEFSKLDRDTRERMIKVEQKVEGIEKSFQQNMQDFKEDLRYIRSSIDEIRKDRK